MTLPISNSNNSLPIIEGMNQQTNTTSQTPPDIRINHTAIQTTNTVLDILGELLQVKELGYDILGFNYLETLRSVSGMIRQLPENQIKILQAVGKNITKLDLLEINGRLCWRQSIHTAFSASDIKDIIRIFPNLTTFIAPFIASAHEYECFAAIAGIDPVTREKDPTNPGLQKLQHLTLFTTSTNGLEFIKHLKLKSLDFRRGITDDMLHIVTTCSKELEKLGIPCSPSITENGFNTLQQLPKLTYLDVNNILLTPNQLREIAACRTIKTLILNRDYVSTNDVVQELLPLENLERISANKETSDHELRTITQFSRLKHLDLSNCRYLTQYIFGELATLQDLETLNLNSTRINAITIKRSFTKLKNLKELDLRNCYSIQKQAWTNLRQLRTTRIHISVPFNTLTDDYLRRLAKIKLLVGLDLKIDDCEQVSKKGWGNFAKLPLEELNLTISQSASKILSQIGVFTNLKTLQIAGSRLNVTNEEFTNFNQLQKLEMLTICNLTNFSDKSLSDISTSPRLKMLKLENLSEITNAGLEHLQSLACLEGLEIKNCPKIIPSHSLQERLRNISILLQ